MTESCLLSCRHTQRSSLPVSVVRLSEQDLRKIWSQHCDQKSLQAELSVIVYLKYMGLDMTVIRGLLHLVEAE